jgi:hypothetical protein
MKRAGSGQQGDEAKRAADRLREATDLLGGAQKQQASGKLDSLGREADRLSKEENAEADRVRKLAAEGEAMAAKATSGTMPSPAEMAQAQKERDSLANDRQQMSDDLEKLQRNLRDAARELAPTQPGAASSLRDALGGLDQTDLTNLVQRTADWLRRGVNPNSNGTEATIATGLKKLDDQVRQAQQAAGSGQPGRNADGRQGTQTAALDHVDRLRSSIEGLSRGNSPSGSRPGQQNGQNGQTGQPGQAQGQQGLQRGQSQQGNQQGQGQQAGQGTQRGQSGQQGQGGRQNGGRQGGQGNQQGGDIANGDLRGGGGSVANYNVDTGGQKYSTTRSSSAPQLGPNPADTQRFVEQGMSELTQLRTLAKGDPAAEKEIADLTREMQQLDPSRFVGNPAMVEELHTKVLNDVDKLELQLRRDPNQPQVGQVRTATPPNVPAGYQDAVAEYYRRLGKGQ